MIQRAATICVFAAGMCLFRPDFLPAQQPKVVWSAQEKPIVDQLSGLRKLPDDTRAGATKALAGQIRALPATPNKMRLANGLANLSTEGDFGLPVLQEVATTLADALRQQPLPDEKGEPAAPYMELAQLVRYEHVSATLDAPPYAAAMKKLETDDRTRERADFTLTDLAGKPWTLKSLSGKVVLVNFWATWCPPCRKEMPDLDALYEKLKGRGLVILAISDEEEAKVRPFITEHHVTYPILLDPGRKVNDLFAVEGIPKSFIFDRSGHLAAQSIDMRTRKQFLEMLGQAGLAVGE